MSVNMFLEKDATVEEVTVKTLGASISSQRRLSPRTNVLVGVSHERIRRLAFDHPEEKSTSRIATASIAHDQRDFILNPRTGGYRDLRVQGAGGFLGGDNDFYTLSTTLQKYYSISPGVVLAARVRVGYADAFGDSKDTGVPIENRYFAGGGNSVRGYEENSLGPREVDSGGTQEVVPVGGRFLALTNVEIRYPIPLLSRLNFSGAVFFDGGNVWSSLRSASVGDLRLLVDEEDVDVEDYRYSTGLGIRYNTPVGPIRLDYGLPLKFEEDQSSKGRFHISLGQIF
jgi:outer membrane protein insertion porin family